MCLCTRTLPEIFHLFRILVGQQVTLWSIAEVAMLYYQHELY